MSRIRPFAPDDIPAIVALRSKTFRHSDRLTADAMSAYLERIFFRNPWRDEGLPSLVYPNATGTIVGFIGVVPRQATFREQPIRVAVGTQLMVDPHARGLVGVALVKAFLAGPQDLAFADVAGDVSRRLWQALGGAVSLLQSIHWTQPLRPGRFYAGRLAQRLRARALAWGLRPVAWAIDGLTARWPSAHGLEEAPLTPALMAAHLPDLLDHVTLRPRYDEGSLRWLLNELAATENRGELRGVAARGADGALVGWYLYYANAGGVGQVVQVAARRDRGGDILHCLFHDAWAKGVVALVGRLEPGLLPALGAHGALLARDGPWVLVQSQHPELLAAIHRGDAFLSRLDGEWWMSF
jgi:hypothetical protein